MKPKQLSPLIIALLAASILAAPLGVACSQETQTVRGDFEATIHQGPSAGLSLAGKLTIEVDPSGNIEGALGVKDGSRVTVTGKLTGGSIQLVLHLKDGTSIFGVGPAPDGLGQGVTIEGDALGPQAGDKGDWEYCIPISDMVDSR